MNRLPCHDSTVHWRCGRLKHEPLPSAHGPHCVGLRRFETHKKAPLRHHSGAFCLVPDSDQN